MKLPGDTQTFAVLKADLAAVKPSSPFLLLNHCETYSLLSLPLVHASPYHRIFSQAHAEIQFLLADGLLWH
jgi:hypothetical protein